MTNLTLSALTRILLLSGLILAGIVAAAEKPVVTVYTYDSFASKWGPGPQIKTNFEQSCDCTLRYIAVDGSAGILNRIQLEGTSSPADIVLGLDNSLLAEAEATGLLQPHGQNLEQLELPVDWDNRLFVPFDYGYFAFIYDSDKLAQPPTSLKQLLDAPVDLKILIQDPRSSTPGLGLLLWIRSIYGDQAESVWRDLSPRIVTVTRSWSEAYGMFLNGEADMVLSYTTSPAYHMIAEDKSQYKAAPFSEGHALQVEVAARLKSAPQPQLADRFMAFILQQGFQSTIATGNWMYPVIKPADGLPPEFDLLVQPTQSIYVDANEVKRHKQTWINEFTRGLSN